jgi:hypothetical protein
MIIKMPIQSSSGLKAFHHLFIKIWHFKPSDVPNLKEFCKAYKSLLDEYANNNSGANVTKIWMALVPHIYLLYFKQQCLIRTWLIDPIEVIDMKGFVTHHDELLHKYTEERGANADTLRRLWFGLVPYLSDQTIKRVKNNYYGILCKYLIRWGLDPNKFPHWETFYVEYKTTLDICQQYSEPKCIKELWHDVCFHLLGEPPMVDCNRHPYNNNTLLDKVDTHKYMLKKFEI